MGNARADSMADVFTLEGGQGRIPNCEALPVRMVERRFCLKDQASQATVTEAVRQKMRGEQEERASKI